MSDPTERELYGDPLGQEQPWPVIARAAYHGLAGRMVETIDPYCEGDAVAVLAHILVGIGNLIGPNVRAQVQRDQHPGRLFAALVGRTGTGRKGTAWSVPRYLLSQVDAEWARRQASGLSSGEGLIWAVRDARDEEQPVREKGRVVSYQLVRVDAGVADKRLMLVETEMSNPLTRSSAEGNTLSGVLRQAWDGDVLQTLTKHSPTRATGSHISIVAHVTEADLKLHLTAVRRPMASATAGSTSWSGAPSSWRTGRPCRIISSRPSCAISER